MRCLISLAKAIPTLLFFFDIKNASNKCTNKQVVLYCVLMHLTYFYIRTFNYALCFKRNSVTTHYTRKVNRNSFYFYVLLHTSFFNLTKEKHRRRIKLLPFQGHLSIYTFPNKSSVQQPKTVPISIAYRNQTNAHHFWLHNFNPLTLTLILISSLKCSPPFLPRNSHQATNLYPW
jgi:hypothetical protein